MFIRKPLYLMADDGGASGAGEGGSADGSAGGAGAASTDGGDQGGKPDEGKTFTQADVDRIIAGRLSKYADYDDLKKQVDDLKAASQTETERAINEAKQTARAEASSEGAKALAREAFDNLAGRKNPDYDIAPALELIDLGRFVKDGQLDRDALKEAVDRIVPEKADEKVPSFGGGPRKQADRPDPGPGLPRLRDAYAQSSK